MNRRTQWLIAIPCSFFALLLFAALGLVLFVNPNRFRPRIEAAVYARTGWLLHLNGLLHWSVWPTLGIDLGPGSLQAIPGHEPLLQWRSFALGAKWPPLLLRRQLVLDQVRIQDLTVRLRVDPQGRGNWTAPSAPTRATDTVPSALPAAAPGPAAGAAPRNASVDGTDPGLLRITVLSLRNAHIEYIDEGRDTHWQAQNVAFNAGVDADTRAGRFALRLPALSGRLLGGTLPASGIPLEFKAPSVELDSQSLSVRMPQWTLQVAEAALHGTLTQTLALKPLAGAGQVTLHSASLRRLVEASGISVRPTRDARVLGAVQLDAQWQLSPAFVQAQTLRIVVDDTHLQGSAQLGLAEASTTQGLYVQLAGDRIELDRYMPPADYKSAPFELPVAALKALHWRGELTFSSARLLGTTLQGVHIHLVDGPGGPSIPQGTSNSQGISATTGTSP